ncbi:MAG: hypothetical protein WA981_16155 [Glaciecola sp.]
MAIISCPACNKPISDKAKSCSHCHYEFGSASAEDIKRKLSLQRYNKVQKIQNQSMLAMLLFIIGCYFVFLGDFSNDEQGMLMYNASVAVTTIGFIWYAVNRVRITLAKRS